MIASALIFVGSSLLYPVTGYAQGVCQDLFDPSSERRLEILEDYQQLVIQKIQEGRTGAKPDFMSPRAEIAKAKNWSGEMAPPLLQGLLPKGITAIDHPLYEASAEGVIKTAAGGNFVSLRAEVSYNGINTGTNAGVSALALVDNATRGVKALVRDEAKAVFIFLHGGGTKTTGHHVGIQMQNYLASFGIDVISLDLPWHGEGPRLSFSNSKATLEFVRNFIKQYVSPADKPVFIGGHSMGGFFADEYMQHYPKSRDSLVQGVISLSGVPDLAPGGTGDQKFRAEVEKAERDLTDERIDPEDRSLSSGLLRQNKVSPVGGAYIAAAMREMNWEMPAHRGQDYLPTLMVMGKGDALYVGAEHVWRDYRQNLSNVDWHLIDAGHLIFDQMIEGTSNPLTYTLIKDFIAKTTGLALEKAPKRRVQSENFLLARLVVEWFNRPVFREFVRHSSFQQKVVTESFKALNERMGVLRGYFQKIEAVDKNNKLSPEEKAAKIAEIPLIRDQSGREMNLDEARAERDRLFAIQASKYIPEGPAGEKARLYIEEMESLGRKMSELNKRRDSLRLLMSGPGETVLYTSYTQRSRAFTELVHQAESPALREMRDAREEVFHQLVATDAQIRDLVASHLSALDRDGKLHTTDFMAELPSEITDAFRHLEEMSVEYQAFGKKLEALEKSEALNGRLGSVLQERALELYGPQGLEHQIQEITRELAQLDREVYRLNQRSQDLRHQYVDEFSEGYFTIETQRSIEVLDTQASEWLSKKGLIEKIISMWAPLWKERPPETGVSLY